MPVEEEEEEEKKMKLSNEGHLITPKSQNTSLCRRLTFCLHSSFRSYVTSAVSPTVRCPRASSC